MNISKRAVLVIDIVLVIGILALAAYLDLALYRLALELFAAHP